MPSKMLDRIDCSERNERARKERAVFFLFRAKRSMVMEFVVRRNAASTSDPFIVGSDRYDANMDD